MVPDSLPRLSDISINWSVLMFALFLSVVAGILFGLAPALQASRLNLTDKLKAEGRGTTGSGEQARMRRVLVVTEFALSLVLMIAAGLLLRSFWDVFNVGLGFNPQNVMAVRTRLPVPNDPKTDIYGTAAQEAVLVREMLRRGQTLPGVEEVAVGSIESVPLNHNRNLNRITFEGREFRGSDPPFVEASTVGPGYFHLLGIPLVHGRFFTDQDNENAPQVAIVNDAFARTWWPNDNPVGKRVKLSGLSTATSWTTWLADCSQAIDLLGQRKAEAVLADKGYDADVIVQRIEETGAKAVIPPKRNRKVQRDYDQLLYKQRNRIERTFSRLKQFRRFATRYEKSKTCFQAMVILACSWLVLQLYVDRA
jgi:transposase